MPRDGSGVASKPAGTTAAPNTTIESAKFNSVVDDIYTLLNTALPITAGGTGETTARLKDGTWRFQNTADTTKLLAFDLSGLTTATTRTQIAPDENGRQALAAHLSGHIYGLTLSNNGTDAANDIDIAAGVAIDAANAHVMTLASALTKRLDAAWAVGTNQGMLDGTESVAGTPDVSTWYHIWLIKRVDTGVVDILASESATAPTMPTNYTLKRRIGAIYNDSAGDIVGFVQNGNTFMRKTPVLTINSTNPGTSAVTRAMSVPTGIVVEGIFGEALTTTAASAAQASRLSALSEDDVAPSGAIADILYQSAASGSSRGAAVVRVHTDTSGQIRSRLFASDAGAVLTIVDMGWVDRRGQ